MNKIILKSYVGTLEEVLGLFPGDMVEQSGVGFISSKPKYHIKDKSVVRLLKVVADEINYGLDQYSHSSKNRGLYWSFNGHGLDSPAEIKEELTALLEAARKEMLREGILSHVS